MIFGRRDMMESWITEQKRLMWHREQACGNLEPMRIPWKKSTAIMENARPVRLE